VKCQNVNVLFLLMLRCITFFRVLQCKLLFLLEVIESVLHGVLRLYGFSNMVMLAKVL